MKQNNAFSARLSSISIDKYRIVYLGMVLLTLLGIYFYRILPRESKPEIVFPSAKITVSYPGVSPEDVESLLTDKLEAVLLGLEEIEFLSSSSLAGRAELQLDFYPEVDLNETLDLVRQAVDSVRDLPEDAGDPIIKVSTTANRPFMVVSLSGDVNPQQLRESADILLKKFQALGGVSEVKVSGSLDPEVRIIFDPARLAEFNLSVDDIALALRLNHKDTPAGDAVLDGLQHYVRVIGAYSGAEEIRRTLIPLPGGGIRLLKDLAAVEETYQTPSSYSRRAVNPGEANASMKTALTISLYRDGGSDIIGPSEEVVSIIADKAAAGLPEELDILVIQDDAVSVRNDLAQVLQNAAAGMLIVVLVLFLFLGLREALITALIIPFSLFIAFIALSSAGMTFNTMTLLAMIIALGLLVDNGIVVVENVALFRSRGMSRKQAAKEATAEVAPSIVAATLTTMAAFIPLALMEGRIGMIISVIPLTVIFIIGSSLLIALTITPTISSRWLPREGADKKIRHFSLLKESVEGILVVLLFALAFLTDGRPGMLSFSMALVMAAIMAVRSFSRYRGADAFGAAARGYERLLARLLAKKSYAVLLPAIMVLLLAASLAAIPLGLIKVELFPVMNESTLYINLSAPEFSSLNDTDRLSKRIEEIVLETDGIASMYSEVGGNSVREAQVVLNLLPASRRSWTTQEKIPQLMKEFALVPGVKVNIGTSAGGRSANSPVQIRLSGSSLEDLGKASRSFTKALSSIDGIRNATSDFERGYPEIQIIPRRMLAADLGVDATDIGAAVRNAVSGIDAGTLPSGSEELTIRLELTEGKMDSADDLEKVLVELKNGTMVPLTHLASISSTSGRGTIRHIGGERNVTVSAQLIAGTNIRDVVGQFDTLASAVSLPDGISYEWAGEAADLDASLSTMTVNFVLALMVVFLILAVQFNSFSQPLIILISVPMSVIGVIAGLLITGNNFGLYAFMGVIALVGIVVNDAIVLMDTINRNRSGGMTIIQALTDAGRSRFAPVLATSLTTIGGMLPLAFRDENFAQLSISLISGLIASTVLTLLVLPLIYRNTVYLKTAFQKRIPIFLPDDSEENENDA